MAAAERAAARDVTLHPVDRSERGEDITMAEWMEAVRAPGGRFDSPADAKTDFAGLQARIAQALRAVADSGDAAHFGDAARLLRELRATDDYLRRRHASAPRPAEPAPEDATAAIRAMLDAAGGRVRLRTLYRKHSRRLGWCDVEMARGWLEKHLIDAGLAAWEREGKSDWLAAFGTDEGAAPNDDTLPPNGPDVFNPHHEDIDRWLRGFLKNGPKSSDDVRRHGEAAGIPGRSLRDARRRIGAVIHRQGYPCRTVWLLPQHRGEHR